MIVHFTRKFHLYTSKFHSVFLAISLQLFVKFIRSFGVNLFQSKSRTHFFSLRIFITNKMWLMLQMFIRVCLCLRCFLPKSSKLSSNTLKAETNSLNAVERAHCVLIVKYGERLKRSDWAFLDHLNDFPIPGFPVDLWFRSPQAPLTRSPDGRQRKTLFLIFWYSLFFMIVFLWKPISAT